MRKVLLLVLSLLSVLMLVACSSNQNLDGEYREFYQFEGYPMQISSVDTFEISGDVIKKNDEEFLLDKENSRIELGNGRVKTYTVDDKTGVITFDDDTYVKVDSPYYKELVENGAEVNE